MPNCDWGRPCDCRDCRSSYIEIKCLNCNFSNQLIIIRDVESYSIDRKNIGSYNFSTPIGAGKPFLCYKCNSLIENPPFYTEINKDACERELQKEISITAGKFCSVCKKIEGYDFDIKILLHKEKPYCKNCLAIILEKEIPNPSTDTKKYKFNSEKMNWELFQIALVCKDCQKKYWVFPSETWKIRCMNCYKKNL